MKIDCVIIIDSGSNRILRGSFRMSRETNGFKNVSRQWLDKCMTYEQGMQALSLKSDSEDLEASIDRFSPKLLNGKMALVDCESGRSYIPTSHCMTQLSRWAGVGTFLPAKLAASNDEQDAETLVRIMTNGLRHVDRSKSMLWRTKRDGTMRAVLSDRYMTVNNLWVLQSISKIIPGGLLSHWRGDEDAIYANVLIPDKIRSEKDSDYGGMLSIGNSEIGTRHLSSLPSVFRSICMNGCIWDRTSGIAMRLRHNGQLDYEVIFESMKEHINSQIPILDAGVNQLLSTRNMVWEHGDILPLFAQISQDFKVARHPMAIVIDAYAEEVATSEDSSNTLFGVINAVTRAGQSLGNEIWHSFDVLGGRLSNYGVSEWESLTQRARFLSSSSIEKALGISL